jgi:hypothetical protein
MGFNINEVIKTELHYKEIANIAVAVGEYLRVHKDTANKDVLLSMERLVNRLGEEMYNCPEEDNLN